jgi:ADP-ribose pyrophosphatase YjhB (NUDIX family)
MRLTSFNENSGDQIKNKIKEFKKNGKIENYILDLRNNPGGLLSQAIKISDYFLENGETVEQGAFRETLEETSTEVKMDHLYAIFNIPQISQIYMLFLAEVIEEDFGPTSESLEVRLFEEESIPWEELAFPFVPLVLKHYLNDKKNNKFDLRIETIERPAKKPN